MKRVKIGRVSKKQQRVIRRILMIGLDRLYYNDCEDIQALAMEFGYTNIDIIACIQYVEVKMLGKYSYTCAEDFNCNLEA